MRRDEDARIGPARLISAREARPFTVLCSDDDRMADFLAVSIALFYPGRLDEAALAAGLERALARAPFYAGRARSADGPFDIECDNSGAAFSTAEVDLTLREAVAAASTRDVPWLVDTIDPGRVRSERAPLFTVRVTHLADGASALGLSVHHSTGDGISCVTVLQAWSAAVEGRPIVDPLVVEDRNAYLDAHVPPGTDEPSLREIAADEMAALQHLLADPAAKALVRVYFSAMELERMQAAFSAGAGRLVSATNALCGHLMGLLMEYDEPGDGEWGICVPADYRTAAGLDPALIGNLISHTWFRFERSDDSTQIAARLRRSARDFARDHLYHHANRRLVARLGGVSALRRLIPRGIDPLRRTLAFTDRSAMGLYDISFGQTPVFVAFPGRRTPPWNSHLSQAGRRPTGGIAPLLFNAFLPAALAAGLSSPEARARVHAFREASDPPPPDPVSAVPDLL